MKLTIFALIAALWVTVATASGVGFVQPTNDDEVSILLNNSEDLSEEMIDIEMFSVFGPMKTIIKGALRSLKSVNCSIKAVLNIRDAAQKFISDINACGGKVSAQVQAVINACKAVISTSNDIIHLNSNVCHNDDSDEASDGGEKTPKHCFFKLLGKMIKLKHQIGRVITLIKKVPQAPVQTSECVTTALGNLTTAFTQFPTFIKNCSKLTSN